MRGIHLIFTTFAIFCIQNAVAFTQFATSQLTENNEISSRSATELNLQPKLFAEKLEQEILAKLDGKASFGVKLFSLKNDQEIIAKNAYHTFIPASNVKIFTAVAALLSLGKNYTFDTQVLKSDRGDIYFKFSGDPSLTEQDLRSLIATMGIRHIQGHVYIDDSAYNGQMRGPGWAKKDAAYCYAAPVSSVIINHNCVKVIEKKNVVEAKSCHKRLKNKSRNARSHYCAKTARTYVVTRVVNDPSHYAAQLLGQILKQADISYQGDIQLKAVPSSHTIMAIHHSVPLYELLAKMLKSSDNLFADSIFKKLGEVNSHQAGNWENGAKAMRKILTTDAKLNLNTMELVDGSGMSLSNQVTPAHVTELLKFAYLHLPNASEFIQALPTSGVDGTLAKRMRQPEIQGKVHAKTGTMKHITALSGYVETKHQDILIFSILINGIPGSGYYYRHIADELLTASAKYL
jgi:D-alanyl-D-alanine carboxypeptidase/D-alanyl-D-alanine-endopeptidase (penicillin-binding protein 4)